MKKLIESILNKRFIDAQKIIDEHLDKLKDKYLIEEKKIIALDETFLTEEILDEARFKIVRARIRGGKVQRRKKVSNIKGYTFRKKGKGPPKLVKMSASEKRRRKLGQRRGKLKRRAKLARIKLKMKRSLRRRKSLGI